VLRTCELSRRPMHADEANQAVKTGELLETGQYVFDPGDHHGPTLYYFGVAAARLRGQRTLAALNETTVRAVPAAFGVLSILLVACLVKVGTGGSPVRLRSGATQSEDGRASRASLPSESILAAALLAVTPPAVYYSRFYIHETLLLTFVLLAFLGYLRWTATRSLGWATATGLAAGCAFATKETAGLFFIAAGIATFCARAGSEVGHSRIARESDPTVGRWRHGLAIAFSAILVAALFYSSFGRNFAGLRDAWIAPWRGLQRATSSGGHEKPWWYYVSVLTYQRNGGLVWHQVLLVVLALIGATTAWRRVIVRWTVVYVIVVLAAFSIVPYKTPWNVIPLMPALAVLAAAGVMSIGRLRTGRLVAGAFAFLTLATLLSQTYRTSFRYSSDARNPFAYVHSSPDVTKYRAMVEAALAANPAAPVRVVSTEYWPLPWYLRGLPRIGYWTTPPAECDGALIIAEADWADAIRERLHGKYREKFLGLRPGFAMVVFSPEAER
jgi:uncharacterized protein (TIGR03663 family)